MNEANNHGPVGTPGRTNQRLQGLPDRLMIAVGVLAVFSLVVEFGFALRPWIDYVLALVDAAIAVCFTADLVLLAWQAPRWRKVWRGRWYEYLLLAVYLMTLVVLLTLTGEGSGNQLLQTIHVKSLAKLALGLTRVFILFNLLLRLLRAQSRWLGLGIRPEYLLVASFGGLVLLGWGLLALPRAGADPQAPITSLEALFTATSSVCVTGLVVRDTGLDFSGFGQLVILCLLQVGGLGIITFVAMLSVASGRGLSVPEMVLLRDVVNARALSEVRRNILGIFVITLVIEFLGSLLLFLSLPADTDLLRRGEWAIFHAASAFCNAGFGLETNSLVNYQGNWGINLTCMGLIVLGGMGFPVLLDLLAYRLSGSRAYRRWRFLRTRAAVTLPRLSTQTKISLVVVAALLGLGTTGIWLLESRHLFAGWTPGQQFLASAFQAVTPRTAGFNTVPINQLQDATQILIMVLMVVGAGPLSTGGGIKTVAFGVLLLTLWSMMAGRDRVEVFGRTLSRRVVHAAISVFVVYTMVAVIITFGLAITDPQMSLQNQIFEAISALSTVGLTTGITPALSTGGKLLLIGAMFVGRIGPLTLAMSVFHASEGASSYRYPEEELVVS